MVDVAPLVFDFIGGSYFYSLHNGSRYHSGTIQGSLMGAPQCRMSILRIGNVACPCRLFSPM